jgi:hypothetical protein
MKFVNIKSSDVKKITFFLIKYKIILHPKISPNGDINFSDYKGKSFNLILDRQILVYILDLVSNGTLKDNFKLKVASSVLAWSDINRISLNSGFALSEYTFFKGDENDSNSELNLFKKIFDFYHPNDFINLATEKITLIPKLKIDYKNKRKDFQNLKGGHFKMHYLEMIKMSQLYLNQDIDVIERFRIFFSYSYKNILLSKYTFIFSLLFFGNRSKVCNKINHDFEEIKTACQNQSWDLSYLTNWSTQYSYESNSAEIYLLSTNDRELRKLFIKANNSGLNTIREVFGKEKGGKILKLYNEICIPRKQPKIDINKIDFMIKEEIKKLKEIIEKLKE